MMDVETETMVRDGMREVIGHGQEIAILDGGEVGVLREKGIETENSTGGERMMRAHRHRHKDRFPLTVRIANGTIGGPSILLKRQGTQKGEFMITWFSEALARTDDVRLDINCTFCHLIQYPRFQRLSAYSNTTLVLRSTSLSLKTNCL